MSLSSWIPQNDESGCWVSEYQYEAPRLIIGSTSSEEFVIHATLEAGADKYYSGIRILISCRDAQDNSPLSAWEVKDMVGGHADLPGSFEDPNTDLDKRTESILLAQKSGCKLSEQFQDIHTLKGALPLYTLFFEIMDVSDTIWSRAKLVLHQPQTIETDWSRRTLYDCVELCTPTSRSCVLFLSAELSFRGTLKQVFRDKLGPMYASRRMGILSYGVRILPPSHHPFFDLPSEVLDMIFNDVANHKHQRGWRTIILSLGLVCRAWRHALDHLYKEFARELTFDPPKLLQLATTIELNPGLGTKIRIFEADHFLASDNNFRPEARYLDSSRAFVKIIQNATRITKLHIFDTHTALSQDLIRALCSCSNVKDFRFFYHPSHTVIGTYRYKLSVHDTIQCMSHWPRLEKLTLIGFSSTCDVASSTHTCSIKDLGLENGHILLEQLRLLTTSWSSALQKVTLRFITGLSNEDLRNWLLEVGPALTSLVIEYTPLSRSSDKEEHGLDAVLPIMVNLRRLEIQGDIASESILLRYVPCKEQRTRFPGSCGSLTFAYLPGVYIPGFVNALTVTEWTEITARFSGLEVGTGGLDEARKVADSRGVRLAIMIDALQSTSPL